MVLVCALLAAPAAHAKAPSGFAGGYNGIGSATGMAMVLHQDQGEVYGRLLDGERNAYQLTGQMDGALVRGRLYNATSTAAFELELKSRRLEFTLIPTSFDGARIEAAIKQYDFARGKVKSPILADYYVAPPRRGETVDFGGFLQNYRTWSADDVAYAYTGISDRDRALINTLDHLQADILYRLCRGGAPQPSLMVASGNEDVDCGGLEAIIDKAAQDGAINRFNDVAIYQMSRLYSAIACGHAGAAQDRCAAPSAALRRAAAGWQPVDQIFEDIVTLGVRSGAVEDEMLDLAALTKPAAAVPSPTEQVPIPRRRPARHIASPRDRPLFTGGPGSRTVIARVDDSVLARTDQSAAVGAASRSRAPGGALALQLRPSLGGTRAAVPDAALPRASARPAASAALVHHSATDQTIVAIGATPAVPALGQIAVPAPRVRPIPGG